MMETAKGNTEIAFSSPSAKLAVARSTDAPKKRTPTKNSVLMKTITCEYVISLYHKYMLIMFPASAYGESY